MKANYILKIENPCIESWALMSKNDVGRHCKSCNKNVVDFSMFSDDEIIKYLSKTSDIKICGRLEHHQIDRFIKPNTAKKAKLNKIITALFLVGATKSAVAQVQKKPQTEQRTISEQKPESIENIIVQKNNSQDSLLKVIEGLVIAEEDKLPLPGVHIKIKGTNSGVITNPEGKFKLLIPENLLGKKFDLELNYIGFKPLVMQIKPSNLRLQNQKEFRMCMEQSILGEITIVTTKSKWWKFWKW